MMQDGLHDNKGRLESLKVLLQLVSTAFLEEPGDGICGGRVRLLHSCAALFNFVEQEGQLGADFAKVIAERCCVRFRGSDHRLMKSPEGRREKR